MTDETQTAPAPKRKEKPVERPVERPMTVLEQEMAAGREALKRHAR